MEKIKRIYEKKNVQNIIYFVLTLIMILILSGLADFFKISNFLEEIEAKSYDLRFKFTQNQNKINPNVVILNIDDTSMEVMEDEYGQMPWQRSVYSKVIDYLESGQVDSIAFDLMFIGYQKGFEDKDLELAKTIKKYNNVYVSMNFDDRENPNSIVLPEGIKAKVENHSKNLDFSALEYSNCRLILKEIIAATHNIGIINFKRDNDGISRNAPIFSKYHGDFYPYLAVRVAKDYIQKHSHTKIDKYIISKDNNLILGDKKIPLNDEGLMTLNWYGPRGSFHQIPYYKVIKSIKAVKNGKKPEIPANYFKDKVVFVGVTVTSSYDIKTTPISSVFPGVEIQTTAFNNIIDNFVIAKTPKLINILISAFLMFITGLVVIRFKSTLLASFTTILTIFSYIGFTVFALRYLNLWMEVVNPIIGIILIFTAMYIIKYLNKSRDFEYTYKLATTDGLTNLYNHRYFQEQMVNNLETSKRYNGHFSLLLIDIDFFKKFNDTYGHQAGDAVLKQVAQLLKRTVRSSDIVARYGGEEMTIILPNTNLDEAYFTANKICRAVAEKPFKLSETVEKHVTISIGVATYPQHAQTPSELIEFADQGLYSAKENGRNQVGAIPGYEPKTA